MRAADKQISTGELHPTIRRDSYDPTGHCPNQSCARGKLEHSLIDQVERDELPNGVTVEDDQAVYRCSWCGLLWTQRSGDSPGWLRRSESKVVGFQRPGERFVENSAYQFDKRHYSRQAARRFRRLAGIEVRVDGIVAELANLSQTGAQLVATTRLSPDQRVWIRITDDQQVLNVAATVVWVSLLPSRDSGTPPHSQVGVTFIDADREAIDVFCAQHGDRVEP